MVEVPLKKMAFYVHPRIERKLVKFFSWLIFSLILAHFAGEVIIEYLQDNPLTVASKVEPPKTTQTIQVKICNEVYIDPQKVLAYNGTMQPDSYQFLKDVIMGNLSYLNSSRFYSHPFRNYFMMTADVYETFKLDLGEFLVACFVHGFKRNCIPDFEFHLDPEASCYKANIEIPGSSINDYLRMVMYFDPQKTMGAFTAKLGAYLTVTHVDDYVPPIRGCG